MGILSSCSDSPMETSGSVPPMGFCDEDWMDMKIEEKDKGIVAPCISDVHLRRSKVAFLLLVGEIVRICALGLDTFDVFTIL